MNQPGSSATFPYKPLEGKEIRVIHFVPSDGPLVSFRIRHVDLGRNPVYWATSYVWGSVEDPGTILLNDTPFSVTRNLHDALQEYRRRISGIDPDSLPPLWVDAICINQTDNKEKSRQIPRMVDIYSRCDFCFAWLGVPKSAFEYEDIRFIAAATKYMDEENLEGNTQALTDWLESDSVRPYLPEDFSESDESDESEGEGSDSDEDSEASSIAPGWGLYLLTNALARLRLSPWFKRVWIVQEVCLPREEPLALMGPHSIKLTALTTFASACHRLSEDRRIWDFLSTGCASIYSRANLQRQFPEGIPLEFGIDTEPRSSSTDLLDPASTPKLPSTNNNNNTEVSVAYSERLLFLAANLKGTLYATDPHDRIYGMLGLLSASARAPIPAELQPDYDLPHEEVFYRYAKFVLGHAKDIRVLCWGKLGTLKGVPSWVPDFEHRDGSNTDSVAADYFTLKDDGRTLETMALIVGECVATFSVDVPVAVINDPEPLSTTVKMFSDVNDAILQPAAKLRSPCICEIVETWMEPALQLHDEENMNRSESLGRNGYAGVYLDLLGTEDLRKYRSTACDRPSCSPSDYWVNPFREQLGERQRSAISSNGELHFRLLKDEMFVLNDGETGRLPKRGGVSGGVMVGDLVCFLSGLPDLHLLRPVLDQGKKRYRIVGSPNLDFDYWCLHTGDPEESKQMREEIEDCFIDKSGGFNPEHEVEIVEII